MTNPLSLDVYQDPYWEVEEKEASSDEVAVSEMDFSEDKDDDGWEDLILAEYQRDEDLWDFSDQPNETLLPAKFQHLETPPPKLARQISWEDELYHARFRLAFKRSRGQKPRYKDKRRSQRFSPVLLQHYVQAQEDHRSQFLEYQEVLVRDWELDSFYEEIWNLEQELESDCNPERRLEIEIRLHELDMQIRYPAKAA